MHSFHLQLVGKCVVDFLFATIEHFSLALMDETLYANIVRRFSKGGWVTLSVNFR